MGAKESSLRETIPPDLFYFYFFRLAMMTFTIKETGSKSHFNSLNRGDLKCLDQQISARQGKEKRNYVKVESFHVT